MPANRSYGDVHYDRVLTQLSVAYFQDYDRFVATKVFPPIAVRKASDKYRVYPRGYFSRSNVDTSIAEETKANRISYGTKLESYTTVQHALRAFISDEERANVDMEQNLDFETTHLVTEALLVGREKEFADNILKTGVWGQDISGVAATPGDNQIVHWDGTGGGSPIEDIRKLSRTMQIRTAGLRPNCLLLSRDVWDVLKDHPDILDRIKGGAYNDKPAMVTANLVAALFEVDKLIVFETVHNTAVDGIVDSSTNEPPRNLSFVKENFGLLFHHRPATNPAKYAATAGVTFVWQKHINPTNIGGMGAGPLIRRYRETPAILGEYIEGRYVSAPKVIAPDCGTYLSGILAP